MTGCARNARLVNCAQSGFDIDAGNPNGIASCSPRLLYSATLGEDEGSAPTSKRLRHRERAAPREPTEPLQGSGVPYAPPR